MAIIRTTVRVRVLVGMDERAQWVAGGYSLGGHTNPQPWLDTDELEPLVRYHWIEADVPFNLDIPAVDGEVLAA